MTTKHDVWAREHSQAKGASFTVLLILAGAADDKNDMCFPSVRTLARWARVDERTVYEAILNLEALGEIVCKRRPGRATIYTLTLREGVIVDQGCATIRGDRGSGVQEKEQRGDRGSGVIVDQQRGDRGSPIKQNKITGREKHIIFSPDAVDVDGETPKQKTPTPAPAHRHGDAAIKRQSHTWVEPAAADAGKLWAEICAQLRMELPPATCDQYFHNLTAGSLAHGVLELVAPYEYQAEFINGRLGHVTARAARSVSGDVAAVRCVSRQRQDDPGYQSVATLLGV
jgi:hypothetical protein